MMIRFALPCLCALLIGAGCNSTTEPDARSVQAQFDPKPGSLLLAQGGLYRFVARSSDGVVLRAEYRVDGVSVYWGTGFTWLAQSLGAHRIEAEVDFGTHTSTGVWPIDVRQVDPELVPVVTEIQAKPGERYGTLDLSWKRPRLPDLHLPVLRYRIHFAQTPFVEIDEPNVVFQTVIDEGAPADMHLRLTELDPRRDCYLKCVSINQLGRMSEPSHLVVARPRGSGSIDLPPPRDLRVETPAEYNALQLRWTRPDLAASVVLDRYEIYWSRFSFTPEQLANATLRSVEATDESMSVQIDGLESDTIYYFRVRAVDTGTPEAALTPLSSGRTRITPIEFTLSGSVREIDLTAWQLLPHGGVTLRAEADSTTSDAQGLWTLRTRTQGELQFVAHTQGAHYPASLLILGSAHRSFDFLLLPVGTVLIDSDLEGLSGAMSRMEFLHRLTGTSYGSVNNPATVYRWPEYPLSIERPTLVRVHEGEQIDYGAAFDRAVQAWNAATGSELLRLVAERPSIGVYVDVDLAPSSGLLGDTVFVQPPLAWFNEAAPLLVRIRLREFNSQELADRIALHELGHCLGLLHSPSRDHVMHLGAPALPIHADEAMLARVLSLLPQATPLSWYSNNP